MIVLAANSSIWSDPEVWVAAAFALLVLFALRQGVVASITKALDDRASGIKADIAEARKLREEAQALLEDSRRKHAAAGEEAAAIVANAKREAEALASETSRALKESVERRTKMAEDKIARAQAEAIAEVRATSVDVSMAAAEALIAGKTASAGPGLTDQSIRDLKGRLN